MARFVLAALGCASMLALASCQTQTPDTPAAPAAPPAPAPVAAPAAPPAPAPQPIAASSTHPGEAVDKASCATCHDNPDTTRAPSRDNLKAMSFQFVNYALTQGKMKDMATNLTAEQRAAVVGYVTGRDTTKAV